MGLLLGYLMLLHYGANYCIEYTSLDWLNWLSLLDMGNCFSFEAIMSSFLGYITFSQLSEMQKCTVRLFGQMTQWL